MSNAPDTTNTMPDPVPWWASPDPFALSPEEQADLDERRAVRIAAMAALPDDPPF